MAKFENPALKAFVAQLGGEFLFAQVLIQRNAAGFELRHVEDRARPETELTATPPGQAREIAQFTALGEFRPLKSAPNLKSGWRMRVPDSAALELTLNQFYPGALADWFAAQSPAPPVTNYREFTGRQSGMYRITAMLDDMQAARVITACCSAEFCLKRRLWTEADHPADAAAAKSLIPCLEPCALLLEFARFAMRTGQDEKAGLPSPVGESGTETLAATTSTPAAGSREADFSSPGNPRRLRWLQEKSNPKR
jgi:hypothetical protein